MNSSNIPSASKIIATHGGIILLKVKKTTRVAPPEATSSRLDYALFLGYKTRSAKRNTTHLIITN